MTCIKKLTLLCLLIPIFCLFLTQTSLGLTINFPDQKLLVGYSSASITRTVTGKDGEAIISRTDALSASLGFGAEYTLFITHKLGLVGQFALHMGGTTSQGTVLMGGGGGLSWYALGGANQQSEDDYIKTKVSSNINLNIDVGLSAKTFNFEPFVEPLTPGTTVAENFDNDVTTGSVFGFYLGVGFEYPIAGFLPGLKVQYVSPFEDTALPSLTIIETWLTVAFLL